MVAPYHRDVGPSLAPGPPYPPAFLKRTLRTFVTTNEKYLKTGLKWNEGEMANQSYWSREEFHLAITEICLKQIEMIGPLKSVRAGVNCNFMYD